MYSSKSIEIVLPYTEDSWHSIVEIRSGLTFESYDLIEQTFEIFGNLIKNIELRKYSAEDDDWYTDYYDDYHTEQHRKIYQLIYKYCSESLIALKLNQCDENTLTYFTIPLEKVENVTISGELKSADEGLKLNQIFPRLQRLTLELIEQIYDSGVLDVTFPHLTHFSVLFWYSNDIPLYIDEFFKRNSQIQDLVLLQLLSCDIVESASEHLPNLKFLNFKFNRLNWIYP